jgi:deoxyribonuclease IV
MSIGAHIHSDDPLGAARARDADVVQFFLGDPQSWKAQPPHPQTDALREAGIDVFVHSPYPVNIASTNNRIRIPSRKTVLQYAESAAATGAKGLIVHGGHVVQSEDPSLGLVNWRKFFERQQEAGGFPLPILIENTAGGDNAMARKFDMLARLWDEVGEFGAGFCLDTCHAHAAGESLEGIVDRVKAITGRIDLVHLNSSRDEFDSARDRHANIKTGMIEPELLAAVAKEAGAPVVVETPADGQAEDIAFLRAATGR